MADVPASTTTRTDIASTIALTSTLASVMSTLSMGPVAIPSATSFSTLGLSATVSTTFSVAVTGPVVATVTQTSLLRSSQLSSTSQTGAFTSSLSSLVLTTATTTSSSSTSTTITTQPALPFLPSLSPVATPSSTASANSGIESSSTTTSANKSAITGSMSTMIFVGVGSLGALLLVAGGVFFFRRIGKSKVDKPLPIDSINNLDGRGKQKAESGARNGHRVEMSGVGLKHQQQQAQQQQTRTTAKSPRTPTPAVQQHSAVQISSIQSPPATSPQMILQQQLYDPGAAAFYKEYTVAQAHVARSQGELNLELGQVIVLMHDYNNGWAYGYSKSGMVYGTFPVACFSTIQASPSQRPKRMSVVVNQADAKPQSLNISSNRVGKETPIPQSTFKVGQLCTAVASFIPDRNDEMGLCIGDKIELQHVFDDDWAAGFNNSTNKDGFFPLECVNPAMSLSRRSDPLRSYPQRIASDCNHAPTLKIPKYQTQNPLRASVASTVADERTSLVGSPPSMSNNNVRIVATGTRMMEVRQVSSVQPDSPPGKSPKHTSLYSIDSVYTSKAEHLQKENDTLVRNEFSKRKSSIYSTMGRASLYTVEERNEPLYTVIRYFEPELEDEIELCARDKVRVLEQFDDGWAVVVNLDTDEEGMVPIRCIERD
ncbi:hypothetical protein CcCBS67573_g02168 [Chytriomyces confervae]|uniref:SH3 domain-containing protein n=1 Tax=Chytriomyces confervae TaxID=246404 RepID=A0A507FLQ2_9FUNG|nr:hypothetical protein HDU80_009422 [Chytriomyces hyalinus]TPX76555.1 hypothetical protein CcCBS67573_g02168 [Chytriomyces confervae]